METARKKLGPLGVDVVGIEDNLQEEGSLPFRDESFSLIINRHESYNSKEIFRILRPGGYFITQQVGCGDFEKLVTLFGTLSDDLEPVEWSLTNAVRFLEEAGMKIIKRKDNIANSRFYDIRTVVFYLRILGWLFPDFDIDLYYKRLENIHFLIKRDGYFEDICHRFFIMAEK